MKPEACYLKQLYSQFFGIYCNDFTVASVMLSICVNKYPHYEKL